MDNEYNVFISWSGERSKWVAEALRDWLPPIIQSAKPWMSETDIDKGTRGFEEIDGRLAGMRLGIVCLTPENLNAPWILYEAGALSKGIGEKTRLWTYLLCGLQSKHIVPPLSMFQGTVADRVETRKLLGAINRSVSGTPLPDTTVDRQFQKWWPDLKEKLDTIPAVREVARPKRSIEDMIAELLDIARAGASDREALRAQVAHLERAIGGDLSSGAATPGHQGYDLRGFALKSILGTPRTFKDLRRSRSQAQRLLEELTRELGQSTPNKEKGEEGSGS